MDRRPTTQQITWFIDLERYGQLELDPPYQRKSVWSPKDRRFFIDTIFRNYPCPPLFLYKETDDQGKTTYNVVDGKQRLETILMFAHDKLKIDNSFGDTNLNGKKMSELDSISKRKFWDYSLVVDFIDVKDGASINEVFDRVNRSSKNLLPQELRHAKFDGWFISEVEAEADEPIWTRFKVSTKSNIKRMKNIQFISELLLILLENKIEGFNQENLDKLYSKYDSLDDIEEFDEFQYKELKKNIKDYLENVDNINNCITENAQAQYNIYSLWALVVLNLETLPSPEIFANKYKKFMEDVENISTDKDFINRKGSNANIILYYENTRGASTDHSQRIKRNEALKNEILS